MIDNDMLVEYKLQIETIKGEIEVVDDLINNLIIDDSDYDLKLDELKNIQNDLNYFLRNLNFAAQWLELGHEPGVYQGIENRFRVGEDTGD